MRTMDDGRRRARRAALALALAAALGGCRDRAEKDGGGAPPDAGQAPGRVEVQLLVPRDVAWNQDNEVIVGVLNGTRAPLADAVLHVFLEAPLAAVVDSAGADTTGRAVPPGIEQSPEGTRLTFPIGALGPGERVEFRPVARTPPAGLDKIDRKYAGRDRFLVRAWLTAPGSTPAGAPAQDTLRVRAGAEVVVGGCANVPDLAVTRYGIGPVRLGMTADALRGACPEARDSTWRAEGTEERGMVVAPGGKPVLAVLARDTVSRVVVPAAGLKTAAGVGVGSTVGDLRTRYGRMCSGIGEGRVAVWFPNAPGISFGLDTLATRGWTPAEASPDSIADEVAVGSLWVRRGSDDCPAGGGGE
ncbi:MAG TPA: hypothetical protein VFQ39_02720 [Longimicrobium sp.]|nr:hypothetical protein [Longimicrobium sp.]